MPGGIPRHPSDPPRPLVPPGRRAARRWRRIAAWAFAFGVVVGMVGGAALSASQRPTERLTMVPAPDPTPPASPGALSGTQGASPEPRHASRERRPQVGPTAAVPGGDGSTDIPFYLNCEEVRVAGEAPLYEEDPGFSARLDSNNDLVACDEGDR